MDKGDGSDSDHSNIISDVDSEVDSNGTGWGDMTAEFNQVDKSFIERDHRKSFGPGFAGAADMHNANTIIPESSDEGDSSAGQGSNDVSDSDSVQDRSLPVVRGKTGRPRQLDISDDDDDDNDCIEHALEADPRRENTLVEEESRRVHRPDPDHNPVSIADSSVIEISSDQDSDFVEDSPERVTRPMPKNPVPVTRLSPELGPSPTSTGLSPISTEPPTISNGPSPISTGPPTISNGPSPTSRGSGDSYNAALAHRKILALESMTREKKMQHSQITAALKNTELRNLPDGGAKLKQRQQQVATEVFDLETKLASLISDRVATEGEPSRSLREPSRSPREPSPSPREPTAAREDPTTRQRDAQWSAIRSTADIQHGYGAKALEHHQAEKAVTLEALATLHRSLRSRPTETEEAPPPRGLRADTTLMPHQRRALAWMCWREKQKHPSGGILADDMGLGKTLTLIALTVKHLEDRTSDDSDSESEQEESKWKSSKQKSLKGGTLVVCPASLINQWEAEVSRRIKSHRLSVEVHHGSNRQKRGYRLARSGLVVTTYAIVRTEHESQGALHQVRWTRVILDEAHTVRNHKSKTSVAVAALRGRYRWCLTGTPVHNKELDLYALIKFLQCSPFDDLAVWKRWIDNKNNNGAERLSLLLNATLLRRTKEQLRSSDELKDLSTKELHEIHVDLTDQETAVYEKILTLSKTMFAQFLHQRHEREAVLNGNTNYVPLNLNTLENTAFKPGSKLDSMAARYSKMTDIKSHVILVLLLRLRQICVHPTLVSSMLEDEVALEVPDVEDELAGAIGNLRLGADAGEDQDEEQPTAVDDVWNPNNPVFEENSISSKMSAVLEAVSGVLEAGPDKVVVVSQWATVLGLLGAALTRRGVNFVMLSGATKVPERMKMVDLFNGPGRKPRVMLLSLTAGGVGLNLVGGNHLFLTDLHWNPQLEAQACDRVFRVGQTKPVHIYKFICKETIEENILALQAKKMAVATDVLTGARDSDARKLTIDDLKMLFNM